MKSDPPVNPLSHHRSFTAAEAADVLGPLQSIGFGSFPSDMQEADFARWFKVASASMKKGLTDVEGVPLQMWGLRSLMSPLGVCVKLSATGGMNLEWRASISLSKWSTVWLKHGTLPDALRMWVAAAAQTGHALSGTSMLAEDHRYVLRELGETTQLLMEACGGSKRFPSAVMKAIEPKEKSWPLEFQEQWGRTLVCAAGMLVGALGKQSECGRWSKKTAPLVWRMLERGARLIATSAPDERRRGVGALFQGTSSFIADSPLQAIALSLYSKNTSDDDFSSDIFTLARPPEGSLWTTLGVVVGEPGQDVAGLAKYLRGEELPPLPNPIMDMMMSWPGEFSGWLRQSYLEGALDLTPGTALRPRF